MKHVTIKKFSEETGYTENAARSKIQRGEWLEGELWTRAPDGRVLLNLEEYEKWVESKARKRRRSGYDVPDKIRHRA